MPGSPRIGEVTAYRESMEGLGLPLARGIEGEHGAVTADKAIIPLIRVQLGHCHIVKFGAECWGGTPHNGKLPTFDR